MSDDEEHRPLLGEANGHVENKDEDDASEPTGCGSSIVCDPRRGVHRYFVLIFMCFLSFGSYFCYDNPAALEHEIKRDMNVDSTQYMLTYSLYSWPNVILCFFGGFLLDKVFGVRWGTIIFSIIVTIGQYIFAVGAFVNAYWLMLVGRFIFGVGGESLCVAQNTYAVNWFQGRALNLVFGLQLSFSRAGSTVNMNIMQPLYNAVDKSVHGHVCLGAALFIAGAFCIFSLICAFIVAFFDKRAERINKKNTGATGEVIQFRDIKDFSITLWILAIICVAYYVAIFPFISLGKMFFTNRFELDAATAGAVNSLVYIISAAASPVFGFCIDKTGKNIYWLLTGVVITIGCHALLAFSFVTPWVAMIIMGFAYSILASSLWPLVALVVPQHQIGTAYGIMQSVQNLGLAVITIVAGKIVDASGYLVLEVFFLACLFVALIAVVALYLVDTARGGMLNMSAGRRRKLDEIEVTREVPVDDNLQ